MDWRGNEGRGIGPAGVAIQLDEWPTFHRVKFGFFIALEATKARCLEDFKQGLMSVRCQGSLITETIWEDGFSVLTGIPYHVLNIHFNICKLSRFHRTCGLCYQV